ncbi:MAG: PqqD family protein [Gaiellales bacterium]
MYRKLSAGSGGVVLHLETAAYHGLNEVGALTWSLLEEETTMASLMQRLRGHFDNAPDEFEDDIAGFVESLAARGLVVVESSSANGGVA